MALSIHLIFVAIVTLQAAASSPVPVSMDDAKAHVLRKVDPVVPPEAAAAQAGGVVSAEVVIRSNGAVETVTILAGHVMLHKAATDALKQWTFKPFIVRGRPVRAITIVDVPFRDPRAEEEKRRSDAYWTAMRECTRLTEARDAAAAERVCGETIEAAERLPPDRLLERSHAFDAHGYALILAGRERDAIAEYERGLSIRRKAGGDWPDADEAAALGVIATLQGTLGEIAAAEKNFAGSVDIFERAIAASPGMADVYRSNLVATLRQHAAFKRRIADTAAAGAIDVKAAALEKKAPEPASIAVRKIQSVTCYGPGAAQLTDDDMRQMRALLPGTRAAPWVARVERPQTWGENTKWSVALYLRPEKSAGRVRHGQMRLMSASLPSATAFDEPRSWRLEPLQIPYSQLPPEGRDADEILSAEDPNQPFDTAPSPRAALTDEDILGIAAAIRAAAVGAPGTTRLQNDVQPWPIRSMVKWDDARANAQLVDAKSPLSKGQFVELRLVEGKWTVTSMR
jgi:tetratricopeptide (TPR) repeat protein